jgi:copper chaperone CopZ
VPKLTLELPNMFGDHHVIEVRRLLFDLPGIEDIYASSGFHVVEITYDEAQLDPDQIQNVLDQAGYLGELPHPSETGKAATEEGSNTYFRHTAAFAQTGKAVTFTQHVPYVGRPLWPCPGMGPIQSEEEKITHG